MCTHNIISVGMAFRSKVSRMYGLYLLLSDYLPKTKPSWITDEEWSRIIFSPDSRCKLVSMNEKDIVLRISNEYDVLIYSKIMYNCVHRPPHSHKIFWSRDTYTFGCCVSTYSLNYVERTFSLSMGYWFIDPVRMEHLAIYSISDVRTKLLEVINHYLVFNLRAGQLSSIAKCGFLAGMSATSKEIKPFLTMLKEGGLILGG